VRESSELDWNEKNSKEVREQLDRIIVAIKSGSFRFTEVFPNSKRADYFSEKERLSSGRARAQMKSFSKNACRNGTICSRGQGVCLKGHCWVTRATSIYTSGLFSMKWFLEPSMPVLLRNLYHGCGNSVSGKKRSATRPLTNVWCPCGPYAGAQPSNMVGQ